MEAGAAVDDDEVDTDDLMGFGERREGGFGVQGRALLGGLSREKWFRSLSFLFGIRG